jgi:DNA-nicking Smr family endonuclease
MKKPGSKNRHLSDEDHAVWQGTAETLEPLKRAKSRVHPAVDAVPEVRGPSASRFDSDPSHARRHPVHEPARHPPPPSPSKPPPLADFDKRKVKRLGKGHTDIEGRIDLHGMRQSEAHIALRRFLLSAVSRGLRMVLVITGKGAQQGNRRSDDDTGWSSDREAPGVLRRNVPKWLAEPELRSIVVSYTEAAIRHGGAGALYIHLRNRDKVK